ncbi:MAG: response regulator [Oleispira sp.]|nr:response regulator [Oleispira sp.]
MTVTQVWQDSDLYFLILVIFIGIALVMLVASVYRFNSVNQADPRLALLWGYVPDVITEIDYEGKILTVNRAVNGFIEAEVIGHSIFEFLSPEGKNIFSESLQDAIDKKEPQRYELELKNAAKNLEYSSEKCTDIDSVWISNRIIPIIDNLKIISLLVITTDITEQKKAHQILITSKANAEKANAAKSQFLASMSHEIRTPMTGMLGMASLLEQTQLNHEQQECVSTIQHSAEHLLSIINDVLDLSKIEANKLTIENESFDLALLMSSLIDMVGSKAKEKGLNIQAFIEEKTPRFIISDSVRLRQILMNFLTNAIKFTMKGHVILRVVALQVNDSSARLRFSVEDSGIGMAADKAAYIFDEYTNAHGPQSVKMGGVGLGLNICRRLANMLGGEVGVVSTPNLGSNFWLDLEVAVACSETHMVVEPVKPLSESVVGLSAWVVDEVKVNRLLMKEVAKRTGLAVKEFNQIGEVLFELEKQSPKLLVFSRELGPSKIDKLIRGIRDIDDSVFLAMTTVEAINLDYDALIEQGVHAYWEWPLGQQELSSILERLFSHDWQVQPNNLITRYKRSLLAVDVQANCRGKILLAEDNLVNQKVASQMLKKMGFDVDIAADGEEALAAWKRQEYDLILMDCHMPVMDGLQATRMIRMQEESHDTPILALTADVISDRKSECLAAGMDGFMSKPIRMDALRKELLKYIK